MIDLKDDPRGVVLAVLARAGARTTGLKLGPNGVLKVSVTQVAEKGKANQAIVALLSTTLRVPKSQIELLSGSTSPRKRFLIHGVSASQLRTRLASLFVTRGADFRP